MIERVKYWVILAYPAWVAIALAMLDGVFSRRFERFAFATAVLALVYWSMHMSRILFHSQRTDHHFLNGVAAFVLGVFIFLSLQYFIEYLSLF